MKRVLYAQLCFAPIITLLLICTEAYCQNVAQPSFEVTSIKAGGNIFATRPDRAPGRLRWTTQLIYLVGYAYDLDFSVVKGASANLANVYSVEATFDPMASEEQIRLMVQSLLLDRFKMKSHRVITETDGYALLVGKSGLKIKVARPNDGRVERTDSYIAATGPEAGVTQITGQKASMTKLAQMLQRLTGTSMWDRTGLSGEYDFEFRFAQRLSATLEGTESYAPLATALKESLGLEMKKQKGPSETLLVDYIEGSSEN
jgi:uncharacterized protein (TIGR03435 family)